MAALNSYSQKELVQFYLELGLFVSEPRPIGSDEKEKRFGSEAWDEGNITNDDEWKHVLEEEPIKS